MNNEDNVHASRAIRLACFTVIMLVRLGAVVWLSLCLLGVGWVTVEGNNDPSLKGKVYGQKKDRTVSYGALGTA